MLLGLCVWTEHSLTEALCACGVFWPQACLAWWDFTHCAAQYARPPPPDPSLLQKMFAKPKPHRTSLLRLRGHSAPGGNHQHTDACMHACCPLYPAKVRHTPSYIFSSPRRLSQHFHLLQFSLLVLGSSLPVFYWNWIKNGQILMRRLAKAKLPRKLKVQLEIRLIGIGVLLMLPTFLWIGVLLGCLGLALSWRPLRLKIGVS